MSLSSYYHILLFYFLFLSNSAGAKAAGLHVEQLKAEAVHLNWEAFEKYGTTGGNLTEERKKTAMSFKGKYYEHSNPWKFADGYFNKKAFVEKIILLKNQMELRTTLLDLSHPTANHRDNYEEIG